MDRCRKINPFGNKEKIQRLIPGTFTTTRDRFARNIHEKMLLFNTEYLVRMTI